MLMLQNLELILLICCSILNSETEHSRDVGGSSGDLSRGRSCECSVVVVYVVCRHDGVLGGLVEIASQVVGERNLI